VAGLADPGDDRGILDEQIRYYRARAGEYDATAVESDDPLAGDVREVQSALRGLHLGGRILELAAGTGLWTRILAESASQFLAVDASPEMLERNAQRVGDARIRYDVADIFALRPDPTWDIVFFGLWLSHVPPGRFDEFWGLVQGLLAPGGRAVFVDEAAPGLGNEVWLDQASGVVRRQLGDGSRYRAIKVLWRPADLEDRLRGLGWSARIQVQGVFYWGWARPEIG
jgi:SAM-dependent methyltransferase